MKKQTKIIGLVIITILIIIILLAIFPGNSGEKHITISSDGSFTTEECESRDLKNQVIMVESKYCSHCHETKPIFLAACETEGITPTILDLSKPQDMAQIESLMIDIQYTPTFILGCDYYIGEKSMQDYEINLNKFISKK